MALLRWLGQEPRPAAIPPAPPASIPERAPAPSESVHNLAGYYVVERSDGRFNVADSGGSFTTRKTRELAEELIQHLIQNGRPEKPAAVDVPAVRTSARARSRPVPEDSEVRKAPHAGGRPKGSRKRKEPAAANEEDALQDFLDANPAAKRTKLGELSSDCAHALRTARVAHADLQVRYDKARILLAAELGYEPEPLRRSQIAELVGTGYDDLKGRTIRRHKLNVLAEIRLQVGDDTLKQMQLLDAVSAQYSANHKSADVEEQLRHELADLVLAGVMDMFRVMYQQRQKKGRKQGRATHEIKIAREAIQAAVVNQIPPGKVAAVARLLEMDRLQLKTARTLYQDFKSGKTSVPYSAQAKSCNVYPDAYKVLVLELWEAGTRASEKKNDEVHNPDDRKDKRLYRKRFLDQTLLHLCDWMNKRGKLMLEDNDFCVSAKKMCDLMPFYIRKPGRHTSLCRYHLEFQHDVEAGRKWSASATKAAGCDCVWPKNEYDMRVAMMCAKGSFNGSEFEYYPRRCVLRHCVACAGAMDKMTCEKCRSASPFVSCMEWLPVPYLCKDGRELESHDFVKVYSCIFYYLFWCFRLTRVLGTSCS